jgi:hypothetical protein
LRENIRKEALEKIIENFKQSNIRVEDFKEQISTGLAFGVNSLRHYLSFNIFLNIRSLFLSEDMLVIINFTDETITLEFNSLEEMLPQSFKKFKICAFEVRTILVIFWKILSRSKLFHFLSSEVE